VVLVDIVVLVGVENAEDIAGADDGGGDGGVGVGTDSLVTEVGCCTT
jgi:hypothetical protein